MDHFQTRLWLGSGEVVPRPLGTPVSTIQNVLFSVSVAREGTVHVRALLFRVEFFVATFASSLQWQLCGAAARRGLGSDARLRL